MFYLARLTSSSSHSLAATIGYARGSELGWRVQMEPADGMVDPLSAALPQNPLASNFQQHRRSPASVRLFDR